MPDEEWQFCRSQPKGASEFIRQLIADYRTIQDPKARAVVSAVLKAFRELEEPPGE